MQQERQRSGWPPTPVRAVAVGAVAGSVFGLVLGLTSLNRPFANAAVFYFLCGAIGAAVAALALVVARIRRPKD